MAYTALYRKFRPAVFEDVKGQFKEVDAVCHTMRPHAPLSSCGRGKLERCVKTLLDACFYLTNCSCHSSVMITLFGYFISYKPINSAFHQQTTNAADGTLLAPRSELETDIEG